MINHSLFPVPSYILDEAKLRQNLELMKHVQTEAGIDIIVALKGYSMWSTFPMLRQYLKGATACSINEARLCYEEMGSGAHTYMAAYIPREFEEVMGYSSHITFNSVQQYLRFKDQVSAFPKKISCGIRVNPEYSEVETALYNPCAPGSRLGTTIENFEGKMPEGIEGLHFHALCESSSYDLEKVLVSFEERFGQWLPKLKWVNMGGGHLMTKRGYDVVHLISVLKAFKARYPNLKVTLEPGSAVGWQTGDLSATVLDIVDNKGVKTIMLDVSFTAHMPDCLEMPYRPTITGASDVVDGKPTYRIGGMSCLSGDFMDEYSFEQAVQIGDLMIFEDMIHYTMVKTTTFNGIGHPSICIQKEDGTAQVVRTFGYEDYKNRLS